MRFFTKVFDNKIGIWEVDYLKISISTKNMCINKKRRENSNLVYGQDTVV